MDCVDSHGSLAQKYVAAAAAFNPKGRSFVFSSTLLTVRPLVAGVAHAVAGHAQPVPAALRVDALGGGNVALGALPAAVALTAPPGVLAVTAAQDRTSS